jgi:hypothetical protein
MKNKINPIALIILGLSSSCDDFLSEIPDNRTIRHTRKISEILVNAYPQANYMEFAETMTDNVFDSGDLTLTTIKNSQNYNWEMQQDINQDTPSAYGMLVIVLLRMLTRHWMLSKN